MRTIDVFLCFTIVAAPVSLAASASLGQVDSHCTNNDDCNSTLICLRGRCNVNYCASPLFQLKHATCTPHPNGYDAQCNYGYEYVTEREACEPVRSSETGFKGKACTARKDCLDSLDCVNYKCDDPCEIYGPRPHVNCTTVYHVKKFTCHEGYEPSTYLETSCHRKAPHACQRNTDCPVGKWCDFYGDCYDPCIDPPALIENANCIMENYTLAIVCHPGYEQIPCTFSCEKIVPDNLKSEGDSCNVSTDCKSSLVCDDGKCIDQCKQKTSEEQLFCVTYNHTVIDTAQCG